MPCDLVRLRDLLALGSQASTAQQAVWADPAIAFDQTRPWPWRHASAPPPSGYCVWCHRALRSTTSNSQRALGAAPGPSCFVCGLGVRVLPHRRALGAGPASSKLLLTPSATRSLRAANWQVAPEPPHAVARSALAAAGWLAHNTSGLSNHSGGLCSPLLICPLLICPLLICPLLIYPLL
jgi:hypothetical protein